MKITTVYFSATYTTKKVVEHIAAQLRRQALSGRSHPHGAP